MYIYIYIVYSDHLIYMVFLWSRKCKTCAHLALNCASGDSSADGEGDEEEARKHEVQSSEAEKVINQWDVKSCIYCFKKWQEGFEHIDTGLEFLGRFEESDEYAEATRQMEEHETQPVT